VWGKGGREQAEVFGLESRQSPKLISIEYTEKLSVFLRSAEGEDMNEWEEEGEEERRGRSAQVLVVVGSSGSRGWGSEME
jgi:hypothetical protein